jgi:ubiquinone/menaquinone biosynthesis C-methylase UbiE
LTPAEAEAERILAEYQRRERVIGREFYALTNPTNLFMRQGQQRALLHGLQRAGALPLGDKRILEVGCGRGQWIGMFEDFGARREQLAGADLDAARIEEARLRFQGADLRVGDASKLSWPDATFDVILQSMMFTSILDGNVRAAVAAEMQRLLARAGVIIWYDFRYNNPSNANVRGISAREIQELFSGCVVDLESVTLAPPLARRIVPRSWLVAVGLERLRVLNTHYLGVIRSA